MDNTRCVDYLNSDNFIRTHSGTLNTTGPNSKHVSGSTPHFWPLTNAATVGTPALREEANDEDPSARKPITSARISAENNTVAGDTVTWQKQTNSPTVFLNDTEQQPTHPHRDKPHGHHHGHSHDLSSVKAIAYTIIAGDGLHNFCDGIAIGAAFANDLRGGLSTSIAVLCHELPHELGDFAVLLHAGMSVKAALFYNLLSSILCGAGTAIGLLLGQMESVDAWLFMLTAGMFVYIALVDMMPELTTNRLKGNRCCHQPTVLFLWQNLGIFLGYLVMLLISLFEDRMI
ncbi:Zinc transporter foi [Fasciolopsis buskii]|uniref:Zinc transporter foi n=1 Tax=Fasciolopsis buskii TaxID=27845 RepID=A0A8E0VF29_9TREM|nr:Zinc transporter foi [Fasciolopsis buski]